MSIRRLIAACSLALTACAGGTTTDTNTTSSGGTSSDAGNVEFHEVAACKQADYENRTAPASVDTIDFAFTPKCTRVARGTAVTIKAKASHPVQAMDDVDGVANPFRNANEHTADVTQTLTNPGFYGVYCTHHGTKAGVGMAGAIWVE